MIIIILIIHQIAFKTHMASQRTKLMIIDIPVAFISAHKAKNTDAIIIVIVNPVTVLNRAVGIWCPNFFANDFAIRKDI